MDAEEVLKYMIVLFKSELEDLNGLEESKNERGVFYGMKTVYVEALEIIQGWDRAEQFGLDFKIEEQFPV